MNIKKRIKFFTKKFNLINKRIMLLTNCVDCGSKKSKNQKQKCC